MFIYNDNHRTVDLSRVRQMMTVIPLKHIHEVHGYLHGFSVRYWLFTTMCGVFENNSSKKTKMLRCVFLLRSIFLIAFRFQFPLTLASYSRWVIFPNSKMVMGSFI